MNPRTSMMCIVASFLCGHVIAQGGYLRKGAFYIQGEVYDQGLFKNNRQLVFRENTKTVNYSPGEAEEYGLGNGDVYVRRTVRDGQKLTSYFLLRLVSGNRTLYELREKRGSRFFIEQDTLLTEIRKNVPLKEQLGARLNPCNPDPQFARWARYGRTSLKRVVLLSNTCYQGFFPRLRLGALAGYEFSSQSLGTITEHIFLQASGTAPLVGIFADVPLGMARHWSMTVQATYQQTNFGNYQLNDNVTVDYQDNVTTLGFPLLLKYRGTSPTWRPFVAFGLAPAVNWQHQNAWISSASVGSFVYLNQGSWDTVKKFQVNGILGGGLEYSLTPEKSVSLELRYKKLIDAQVGPSQSLAIIGSFYF